MRIIGGADWDGAIARGPQFDRASADVQIVSSPRSGRGIAPACYGTETDPVVVPPGEV
jgi:hypothetical protein